MAAGDYRSCDVCGGKAFYDAHLNYEGGVPCPDCATPGDARYAAHPSGDGSIVKLSDASARLSVDEIVAALNATPGDAEAVTSAEINALPDRIRQYIAALETEADPAGTIRQNILVREENEMLRRLVAEGDAGAVAWQFRMHRTLPDGSRAGWQDCTKAHFDELNHPYQCDYDTRALYTRPVPPVVDDAEAAAVTGWRGASDLPPRKEGSVASDIVLVRRGRKVWEDVAYYDWKSAEKDFMQSQFGDFKPCFYSGIEQWMPIDEALILLNTHPAPPVVDEAMVAKAYRVCEDFIEEHGDGYINDLSDGQWNEMLRAALAAALGKGEG